MRSGLRITILVVAVWFCAASASSTPKPKARASAKAKEELSPTESCSRKCNEQGMDLAGMVIMQYGPYGCVCRVRPSPAAGPQAPEEPMPAPRSELIDYASDPFLGDAAAAASEIIISEDARWAYFYAAWYHQQQQLQQLRRHFGPFSPYNPPFRPR